MFLLLKFKWLEEICAISSKLYYLKYFSLGLLNTFFKRGVYASSPTEPGTWFLESIPTFFDPLVFKEKIV